MLKETALRKKLQETGIPSWGTKDLMKRRHIEWINLYNSNCDADESLRKSHRQLLRELEEWEQTQGGKANNKESTIMKKDFDGEGYAKSHKTEFEDLIARARQKRATPKTDSEEPSRQNTPADGQRTESRYEPAANGTEVPSREPLPNHTPSGTHLPAYGAHDPYANNQSASAITPAKDEATNRISTIPTLSSENLMQGKEYPLGSPSRQVPIYELPKEPVRDIESNATLQ
jgi:E3 ubiquitin-protein ligase RAD18